MASRKPGPATIWMIVCRCKIPRHSTDKDLITPWVFWSRRKAINALCEGICDGVVTRYVPALPKRKKRSKHGR
jgi:hypothetical protein